MFKIKKSKFLCEKQEKWIPVLNNLHFYNPTSPKTKVFLILSVNFK